MAGTSEGPPSPDTVGSLIHTMFPPSEHSSQLQLLINFLPVTPGAQARRGGRLWGWAGPYLLPVPWEVGRPEAQACACAQNNLSSAWPTEKMGKRMRQRQRRMGRSVRTQAPAHSAVGTTQFHFLRILCRCQGYVNNKHFFKYINK